MTNIHYDLNGVPLRWCPMTALSAQAGCLAGPDSDVNITFTFYTLNHQTSQS